MPCLNRSPHDCRTRWSLRWIRPRDSFGASRADVIRLAVEHYLEDFDDLSVAIDRLRDPTDPVLDWDQVRRELLDTD